MKLKSVLDTLDGLDDALKGYYTEKDGKFILGIDGHDDHPDVKGLKTSLATVRTEKKALEAKISDLEGKLTGLPDDFTAEDYNRLVDAGSGNIDQKLDTQRVRLTAEKDTAVKKVTEERDAYKGRIEKLASENAINAAIVEANIAAHMQKAVRAMFANQVKVDFENDDTIVTIENLPVVDKIKAWAGTEEGKYFVAAPANGGGGGGNNQPGAGGNVKDNPWSKEGFNLTKQAELLRDDPAKAATFKAQAGK